MYTVIFGGVGEWGGCTNLFMHDVEILNVYRIKRMVDTLCGFATLFDVPTINSNF